jgi:head-tail adaptor
MSIRAHTSAQRLSDRVHLERASRDTATGDVTGWLRLASSVQAAVDGAKARGAERVVADGTRSVAGYTVWLRADVVQRFAIAVDDRVLWKGRALDIKDAPDQGLQGRLIALLCEAGVNQG